MTPTSRRHRALTSIVAAGCAAASLLLPARGSALDAETRAQDTAKFKRAMTLAQNCRFDGALKLFREVEVDVPDKWQLHANIASALLLQKKYERALREAEEAVSLDRNSTEAAGTLGLVLFRYESTEKRILSYQRGVLDSALAVCRKGTRAKGKAARAQAYECLGLLQSSVKDRAQAIPNLLKAITLFPAFYIAEFAVASDYEAENDGESAALWYQNFVRDGGADLSKHPACEKYVSEDIKTARERLRALGQ